MKQSKMDQKGVNVKQIFQQNSEFQINNFKVQTFWEVHKNLRTLPHALYIYLVNVQTMRKIFFKFCVLLKMSEVYQLPSLK